MTPTAGRFGIMWPSNDLHDPCWFFNPHFLAFRIWFLVIIFLERYWIFIPGAIFGKNVRKIIKSHVPETAPRPKDEEKHENDANSCWFSNVTIVPFHSVHSVYSHRGHVGSREPLLTLFHVIDVGFNFENVQFLHFEKIR